MKIDTISNYQDFKAAVLTASTNGLLFHAAVSIGKKDVSEFLGHSYCCTTCNKFYRKYGNLMYVSEAGQLESIWKLSGIAGGEELAEVIERASIDRGFTYVPSVGVTKYVGDYEHFNFNMSTLQRHNHRDILESAMSILSRWVSGQNGFKQIEHVVSCITELETEFNLYKVKRSDMCGLAAVRCLLTAIAAGDYTTMAVAVSRAAVEYAKGEYGKPFGAVLLHFNGSSSGAALERARTSGHEAGIAMFLAVTDPLVFRMRNEDKVTQKTLVDATDKINTLGLNPHFNRVPCTLDDFETLWHPEPVKEVVELDAIELALASKTNNTVETKPTFKTAIKISFDTFLNKLLPSALSIKLPVNAENYWYNFTKPAEISDEVGPLTVFDKPEVIGRRTLTDVNQNPISMQYRGLNGNTDFTVAGFCVMNWHASDLATREMSIMVMYESTVTEYQHQPMVVNGIIVDELYQNRADIDYVAKFSKCAINTPHYVGINITPQVSFVVHAELKEKFQTYHVICDTTEEL